MERLENDLKRLFHPESIAIVGVPRGHSRFGGASYLNKFQECKFPGRLYPVNPKADEIQGVKAYPTLASLPEVPDLVMVCLPAAAVLDVLEECAHIGARHIHILTSGFKELQTEEGRRLEERLAAFSKQEGLSVVGPNCMGPYNPAAHLTAWGAIPGLPGPVGVISQSGTITQRITEYLCSLGLGIAKAVSMGNAAVLGAMEYLEFMAQDEEVRTIAMYLESVPDARAFLHLAREVNRKKPLVIWKGGESDVGASTAVSHTGGMSGANHLWEAFFRQSGVARVRSMDEWADTIMSLSLLPAPHGKGVFLVGGGGGQSVVNGDACIRQGLDVPPLSGTTMEKLREIMPAVGSIPGNPLDYWRAYEDADHFASCHGDGVSGSRCQHDRGGPDHPPVFLSPGGRLGHHAIGHRVREEERATKADGLHRGFLRRGHGSHDPGHLSHDPSLQGRASDLPVSREGRKGPGASVPVSQRPTALAG